MNFEIGERVMFVGDAGDEYYNAEGLEYGDSGVVRRVTDKAISVEFDHNIGGHDLDGLCSRGFGQHIRKTDLAHGPMDDELVPSSEEELTEFLVV